ncbi:hypothetical protein TYRP_005081 [Tyrophagus putrescentiae]|nr:hypothetical protein TYRP_005081 [Tyrophagus putrescentiae]
MKKFKKGNWRNQKANQFLIEISRQKADFEWNCDFNDEPAWKNCCISTAATAVVGNAQIAPSGADVEASCAAISGVA